MSILNNQLYIKLSLTMLYSICFLGTTFASQKAVKVLVDSGSSAVLKFASKDDEDSSSEDTTSENEEATTEEPEEQTKESVDTQVGTEIESKDRLPAPQFGYMVRAYDGVYSGSEFKKIFGYDAPKELVFAKNQIVVLYGSKMKDKTIIAKEYIVNPDKTITIVCKIVPAKGLFKVSKDKKLPNTAVIIPVSGRDSRKYRFETETGSNISSTFKDADKIPRPKREGSTKQKKTLKEEYKEPEEEEIDES